MYELSPLAGALRNLGDFERAFFGNGSFSDISCDIMDKGDHYELAAELPGFDKEDIKVKIDDDVMTISASHKSENEETDKRGYLRRERRYGAFSRSFNVANVSKDGIKAQYRDGILRLTMPKNEREQKHGVTLEIE